MHIFPPLQLICSYVFVPVAFLMGVEWKDCRIVAELIGTKTFINEFVADFFQTMGEYQKKHTKIEEQITCFK